LTTTCGGYSIGSPTTTGDHDLPRRPACERSTQAAGSEALGSDDGVAKGTIRNAIDRLRADGLIAARGLVVTAEQEDLVTEPATAPEQQPVVAAIVTSPRGVLAGRRNDGKPPWTFIAGEIEPGESQADAAVREVKEETGLEVRAGHQEISRRVHPKTRRTMIYLACSPVGGTEVFVGDEDPAGQFRAAATCGYTIRRATIC
jgi:ADP-ribose pyrophosphatase YjhB (NUDIX family)